MPPTRTLAPLLLMAALAAVPAAASAQTYSSIGVGIAHPVGDLGDVTGAGFTVRGQTGLSLVLADVHLQTGWTHLSGEDVTEGGVTLSGESADIFHAGVGARLGVGLGWVGANAAYFFGDGDDGPGFFPEVGVGIGPIEGVVDLRIDGDEKWLGLRAGLRF